MVRRDLEQPGALSPEVMAQLRYILSFSKLTVVRNEAGEDVDVAEHLAPHRWRVVEALRPHLEEGGGGLATAAGSMETLLAATRKRRKRLLDSFALDRENHHRII